MDDSLICWWDKLLTINLQLNPATPVWPHIRNILYYCLEAVTCTFFSHNCNLGTSNICPLASYQFVRQQRIFCNSIYWWCHIQPYMHLHPFNLINYIIPIHFSKPVYIGQNRPCMYCNEEDNAMMVNWKSPLWAFNFICFVCVDIRQTGLVI